MTLRDIALATFVSVTWGLAFVAMRLGLDGFTPSQLTALRFLVASIPVVFVARPVMPWRLLISIGLSLFAIQFLLLFMAFRHGMPPGLASVTQQSHVFLTVLLAGLLFGEWPTVRQGLGMMLAVAGLVLIGLTVGADLPALALALALAGALSWAFGNLMLKHARNIPMFSLIAWCSLVPPLPMLLLSAWWDEPSLPSAVAGAPWASLVAALLLGVATWAYAVWGALLGRYPAAMVAPLVLLSPVTGVVVSALVFGERFSSLRAEGMFLILAGLTVVVLRAPHRSVSPSTSKPE